MTATKLQDRLLERLSKVRDLRPELRFGQMVAIIGLLAEDETGRLLWDVEDAEFEAALERFVADLAREGSDAKPFGQNAHAINPTTI